MTINNNNIFGAFTLNEARGSRLTGDWLNKESVANYGWFGGGFDLPGTLATVDRVDFSNDSINALARGSLSLGRRELSATGNSNYGWFGGGAISYVPTVVIATVDRIDFSNDSSTALARGPLSSARYSLAATGNSNYGWFGGGNNPPVATVDRIDFSNDSTTASPRGPLSLARSGLAATGNSNYGWFGGGFPGPLSTVDRIDFSNDLTQASPRGPLSLERGYSAATGNSNYGWFGNSSKVDRIDFSNDSATASVRGSLLSSKQRSAATGNSNYGWWGGGLPAVATVNRIDFSNDTGTASPRGGALSAARYDLAATSGVLNIRRQKAVNYGWFGGGNSAVAAIATVDRIDFSNDSPTPLPRGPLSLARQHLAATSNSNYGWFGGGSPGSVATVDRIDFSNDSTTALVRGSLSLARNRLAATGNSNYGWFGGGYIPGTPTGASVTTVDRIDFSNDSATASIRGSLISLTGRHSLAATGNSNYGWFGGGIIPTPLFVYSIVDRIDFSNDSPSASVRGPLFLANNSLTATGNSNYGWFGGSGPGELDRIDFSNDTVKASQRGSLTSGRYYAAATGNSNYGWWGGGGVSGSPPLRTSIVERINFSNDVSVTSPRGSFSIVRGQTSATSNAPIG